MDKPPKRTAAKKPILEKTKFPFRGKINVPDKLISVLVRFVLFKFKVLTAISIVFCCANNILVAKFKYIAEANIQVPDKIAKICVRTYHGF